MKILATGGAGFIGSEFVRQAVKNGIETVVVDKLTYAGDLERLKEVEGRFKFYKADITNKEFIEHILKTEKPNIIVHCEMVPYFCTTILSSIVNFFP